jgi:hypothetical protein
MLDIIFLQIRRKKIDNCLRAATSINKEERRRVFTWSNSMREICEKN